MVKRTFKYQKNNEENSDKMNVLEKYNKYTKQALNCLNDKRQYAGQTFRLNTDTHMVFKYDIDFGWIYTPIKTYAHSDFYADNLTMVVDVRAPEKEGFVAQPILRDMSEPEFANRIMNVFDWVRKCPEPACAGNFRNSIKKNNE